MLRNFIFTLLLIFASTAFASLPDTETTGANSDSPLLSGVLLADAPALTALADNEPVGPEARIVLDGKATSEGGVDSTLTNNRWSGGHKRHFRLCSSAAFVGTPGVSTVDPVKAGPEVRRPPSVAF